MNRLLKSKAKGKAQMAKGKRPNSSVARSQDGELRISDSALPTSDSALQTSDLGLRTSDSALPTSDSALQTSDLGLRTSDLGLRTSDSALPTSDLGLRTSDSVLPTSDLGLRTSDSALQTSDLGPRTSDSVLPPSGSVLSTLLKTLIPVLPYQDRWILDDSQLKIAVWSRQTGKSFAAALRATVKCLQQRTQYIILSKGERQSRLFMEKVKDFCEAFKRVKVLPGFAVHTESEEKTMEVYFPHNRSRIIGLPANPDTARGYSGHIVLDEFAFHGDAQKIYAACFPIITRGYSIEVISTPNGTAGKFYEIAKQAGLVGRDSGLGTRGSGSENPLWSGHRVDIYDAIRQGLPANLELLRAGCDDEETWLQEYGCQFISDAQNYIPIELISTCVSDQATTDWPEVLSPKSEVRRGTSDVGPRTSDLYLGVDIGRKHDFTIVWLFEKVGDVLWSRVLLTLKGVTFDEQERIIFSLLDLGVRRAGIDASGLGMMLAEHAVEKYGEVVEPTTFTAPVKERLAPLVKQAFEDRTVRIPDNREVRADINSVKRFVTPAGNVRFDAEHTDRGHADRFWALAMVVNAATRSPADFCEQAFLVGEPVTAGLMSQIL